MKIDMHKYTTRDGYIMITVYGWNLEKDRPIQCSYGSNKLHRLVIDCGLTQEKLVELAHLSDVSIGGKIGAILDLQENNSVKIKTTDDS